MIEVNFGIFDEVFYFNTSSRRVEKATVKEIRIIPRAISKDSEGKDVCEGLAILYFTVDGPVLAAEEVFATEDECKKSIAQVVKSWEEN